MKFRMASNASVFANRGDPWISERDQNGYGRRDDEDPDKDRYTKATAAVEKALNTPTAREKSVKASEQRRIQSIAMKLHRELAKKGS